jgi:hypothetical protein
VARGVAVVGASSRLNQSDISDLLATSLSNSSWITRAAKDILASGARGWHSGAPHQPFLRSGPRIPFRLAYLPWPSWRTMSAAAACVLARAVPRFRYACKSRPSQLHCGVELRLIVSNVYVQVVGSPSLSGSGAHLPFELPESINELALRPLSPRLLLRSPFPTLPSRIALFLRITGVSANGRAILVAE